MKGIVGTILKIVAALAAIAGIVYVAATYGDRIVAWAKNLLNKMRCNDFFCFCGDDCCCEECDFDEEAIEAEEADFEN